MFETLRYTYRLRPGAQAEDELHAEWNRCRFLWNEAVHQQRTGRRPTFCRLSKLLTAARSEFTWLRDGSQVAQQQTLRGQVLGRGVSRLVTGDPWGQAVSAWTVGSLVSSVGVLSVVAARVSRERFMMSMPR